MSDDSRPSPSETRSAARTAVVIPAAGRGVRLGPGAPKALRALNGTPMLIHAVRAMAASRAVSLVVVVAPPDGDMAVYLDQLERLLAHHRPPHLGPHRRQHRAGALDAAGRFPRVDRHRILPGTSVEL